MSKKLQQNHLTISRYICSVLLVFLFALQFTPFWTYISEEKVTPKSIEQTSQEALDAEVEGETEAVEETAQAEDAAQVEEVAETEAEAPAEDIPVEYTIQVPHAVAINKYVWFPYDYEGLEAYFTDNIKYHKADEKFAEVLKANDAENYFKEAFKTEAFEETCRKILDEAKANKTLPEEIDVDEVIARFSKELTTKDFYKKLVKEYSSQNHFKKAFSETLKEAGSMGMLSDEIDTEYLNKLFNVNLDMSNMTTSVMSLLNTTVSSYYQELTGAKSAAKTDAAADTTADTDATAADDTEAADETPAEAPDAVVEPEVSDETADADALEAPVTTSENSFGLNNYFEYEGSDTKQFVDKVFADTIEEIKNYKMEYEGSKDTKSNLFKKSKDVLYDINATVRMPILSLLLLVLAIVLNAIELCKKKSLIAPLVTLICSIVCYLQYTSFVFTLGCNYKVHVVFSILLFIFSVASLCIKLGLHLQEKKAEKTEE